VELPGLPAALMSPRGALPERRGLWAEEQQDAGAQVEVRPAEARQGAGQPVRRARQDGPQAWRAQPEELARRAASGARQALLSGALGPAGLQLEPGRRRRAA